MDYANQFEFYERFWRPVCDVVETMCGAGAAFDVVACGEAHSRAAQDAGTLGSSWDRLAPGIEPESPKQLAEFLFSTKKFPVPPVSGTLKAVRRAKRGEKPTGEAALDWLLRKAQRPENKELLSLLMRLRKVLKLAQFLKKLPDFVHNGILYSSFGTDTGTGRLASRNPNLQNIPGAKNDPYGIRKCFVAPPGHKLLVADYNSLELRILAHWLIAVFGDYSLARALGSGDVYGAAAKQTWPDRLHGVEPHELKEHPDPEIRKVRDHAKIIVLSSNYGKSVGGLALQLRVTEDEAEGMLGAYFRAYPGIPRFQQWAYDQLGRGGIRTLCGRTRELDPGDTEYTQAKATRVATNTIIQGSAADVVYGAMLKQRQPKGQVGVLQLQIHDELVWRVPKHQYARAQELITAMEHPFDTDLKVPLTVDWHLVNNWAEAK